MIRKRRKGLLGNAIEEGDNINEENQLNNPDEEDIVNESEDE